MELNILFLNVLKYKDKETGVEKVRFSYLLNDSEARQDTSHFKGLNELSFYTDSLLPFEKLQGKDSLTPMILKVDQKPSPVNPIKFISQVTSIKTKNEDISLL